MADIDALYEAFIQELPFVPMFENQEIPSILPDGFKHQCYKFYMAQKSDINYEATQQLINSFRDGLFCFVQYVKQRWKEDSELVIQWEQQYTKSLIDKIVNWMNQIKSKAEDEVILRQLGNVENCINNLQTLPSTNEQIQQVELQKYIKLFQSAYEDLESEEHEEKDEYLNQIQEIIQHLNQLKQQSLPTDQLKSLIEQLGPLHKQVDELVSLMIVITLDDFDPEESFNTDSEIDWDKVREISASIREAFNRF